VPFLFDGTFDKLSGSTSPGRYYSGNKLCEKWVLSMLRFLENNLIILQ